jgi:hypothetical protein
VETTTAANPFVELANQLTAQAVAVHAVLLRQIEAMSPSDPDDREEFDVLRKQFVEYQTEIQSLVGSQAGVIESDRALRGGAASRLIRPLPSPWPQRQPKNRCGVSVCPHRRFRLQCFRSGSYLSWRAVLCKIGAVQCGVQEQVIRQKAHIGRRVQRCSESAPDVS